MGGRVASSRESPWRTPGRELVLFTFGEDPPVDALKGPRWGDPRSVEQIPTVLPSHDTGAFSRVSSEDVQAPLRLQLTKALIDLSAEIGLEFFLRHPEPAQGESVRVGSGGRQCRRRLAVTIKRSSLADPVR